MARNLRAYYYGFDSTGVDAIDAVLEAVARAGKAYHNTSDWNESWPPGEPTPIEITQDAANDAARDFERLQAERDLWQQRCTILAREYVPEDAEVSFIQEMRAEG